VNERFEPLCGLTEHSSRSRPRKWLVRAPRGRRRGRRSRPSDLAYAL